ncbi:hypothetical protein AO735_09080 [Pseudomonas sp. TTU2014-096BSC]|nr:hypothetical protein AO735_09080 [Pseudomonas sp. TTU2014-096BSC]
MLSTLELCHQIECALLPLECTCEAITEDCLTITIIDGGGRVQFKASNIKPAALVDRKSINRLVTDIKSELQLRASSKNGIDSN